jgi:hypothetical protein
MYLHGSLQSRVGAIHELPLLWIEGIPPITPTPDKRTQPRNKDG